MMGENFGQLAPKVFGAWVPGEACRFFSVFEKDLTGRVRLTQTMSEG